MKKAAVVAVFIIAGLALVANAQSDTKYSVSILDGAAIPVSGLWHSNALDSDGVTIDMSAKTSPAGAVAVDYKLNSSVAVGMEAGRSWAHPISSMVEVSGGTIAIGQYTPYVKVIKQIGRLTPYGILGAGLYTVGANTIPEISDIDGLGYGHSYGYFGFNAGLGATYALGGGLEIGLDARWHHVCSNFSTLDLTNPDMPVSQIVINNITPSLRIQYDFNL
jgi:hypothetical protein